MYLYIYVGEYVKEANDKSSKMLNSRTRAIDRIRREKKQYYLSTLSFMLHNLQLSLHILKDLNRMRMKIEKSLMRKEMKRLMEGGIELRK